MRAIVFVALLSLSGALGATFSDVNFFLYTNANQTAPTQINVTDVSQNLTANASLVYIIHGWMDNYQADWVEDLKDAFYKNYSLSGSQVNVILVDWALLAADPVYLLSSAESSSIGQLIANITLDLVNAGVVSLSNVHLAGHSLGADIAGFAGKAILQATGSKVGRITGMDPAGPDYEGQIAALRLDKGDAVVVLVIHTDRGSAGYIESCGTLDLYPNGGTPPQPGCLTVKDVGADEFLACSHVISHEFFTDSLNHPKSLIGTACSSYLLFTAGFCGNGAKVDMGGYISASVTGDFYLRTNPQSPYGQG